ncbi:hypothetical protein K435DRAFT_715907 [Dendrothele bispora CBS 962.96]|uniref:ATPase, F0 complex, subunit J n=1 Tax=Dendrothele bispora (strain CBS 962.96) TaxID=1314807 RepID=A0A4S8MKQ2_DENBC|nr:hypothetical protein K435DRAFT_715907 [Dendrothele bispora CBS 962.96]
MSFLGYRKWPTPIARPLWPFMVAGSITIYYVAKIQDAAIRSPEYATNPKNPYATKIAAESPSH